MTAEELAELFHTIYERLAPAFGYETRPATAKAWSEIPPENNNKRLMIAVCAEVLEHLDEENDIDWTPEQLEHFQHMWNELIASNGGTRAVITTVEAKRQLYKLGLLPKEQG